MRKVVLAIIVASGMTYGLGASEGGELYKKCQVCHGVNAEKVYAGKVPALIDLDKESLISKLQEYKDGTLNNFGMGPVMQAQAKMNLADQKDFDAVVEHILSLK